MCREAGGTWGLCFRVERAAGRLSPGRGCQTAEEPRSSGGDSSGGAHTYYPPPTLPGSPRELLLTLCLPHLLLREITSCSLDEGVTWRPHGLSWAHTEGCGRLGGSGLQAQSEDGYWYQGCFYLLVLGFSCPLTIFYGVTGLCADTCPSTALEGK